MPKRKDTVTRCTAAGLLESHWRPLQVAKKLHVGRTTAYHWEERMQMFHSQIDRPEHLQMNAGRPNRIHDAAAKALLEYIQRSPWVYQDEMALFLEEEWDIRVNRSTISRFLKKNRLRNKRGQRIGHTQSQALRIALQA